MDSGDDSSSSDDSGSNTGHETSSATTPTCAISPSGSSSNETKIKNTVISGEGAEGPVTTALNLQEHQDSSWLNIDHFADSHLEFEDSATEGEYQKMGNIKDGQAEDGPGDEGWVEHGGDFVIADPEMDGIEVDGDGSHGKDCYRAGVGGDAEGWWYPSGFSV